MYRSWAYILMVAATLAGIVALLWPSPPVRTIEEIAMPARTAPARPEPAAKPSKPAGKPPSPPKRAEAPAPPAVVKRIPAQNTTTARRGAAVPANGMQPGVFGKPGERPDTAEPPPPKPAITPRPLTPPRPPAAPPPRDPAAR